MPCDHYKELEATFYKKYQVPLWIQTSTELDLVIMVYKKWEKYINKTATVNGQIVVTYDLYDNIYGVM